ncbi:hypothetical protein PSHT_11421 [Puccinia striiformis]|uniref:DUF6589 domain-containing protein n=1 Tax=Puccinia striiformis TaxID=27350 RepID=A0A2S4V374_9BASI|nr:hypothetical protein PSHT_11421 [Puccinia striiformis]
MKDLYATNNNQPVEVRKTLDICRALNELPTKMTPKRFIQVFLTSTDSQIVYLRRIWAILKGLPSSLDVLNHVRDQILETDGGGEAWADFAIKLLAAQQPPRGYYPNGRYHSSTTLKAAVLKDDELQKREMALTTEHMPLLYNLILATLKHRPHTPAHDEPQEESADGDPWRAPANGLDEDDPSTLPGEMGGVSYMYLSGAERLDHRLRQWNQMATTICSMVAFGQNRRHNGLQLTNVIPNTASRTLSKEGEAALRSVMQDRKYAYVAPSICIDDIDMEQRVHDLSVGNRSRTFCGTWGYIHLPNHALLRNLDMSELTLQAYHTAIHGLQNLSIEPHMFLPLREGIKTEEAVWKSQIARVLLEHLALPSDTSAAYSTRPPPVEEISHEKPSIHMLKLMDASDNSAEGIGQPMDGDLGTIQNFNSLRSQRTPSPYGEDSLKNVVFQLGAAHTLWNISSTIFTHHSGDTSDSKNLGAWQYLEALGFPAEKAIQKKDFTLMVNQMEKVFEATLYYCLRLVLLLTVVLPPSMRTYLSHNLLFSPSVRKDHFVAKDQWLEVKNYWLKFLFNKHGKGTQIDRLCRQFSVNIDLLQEMYHSLKRDCGANAIHQSHKNTLSQRSLEMFMMMANRLDILVEFPDKDDNEIKTIDNTDLLGFSKMKQTIRTTDPELKKYKKHLFGEHPEHVSRVVESDNSQEDSSASQDM